MSSLGKHFLPALISIACFLPAISQADEIPAPVALPAQTKPIEGILVPVPKEIFHSLDEFHNVNWRGVQRPEVVRWKSRGDEVQIALLLGVVVAEGFIAMEAEDASEVRDVGTKVLSLGRALGVERTLLRRSKSITDCTDKGEWTAARKEWDGVLSDLEERMIAIESESLLQLASLGGWARGTEALCALVLQEYSPDHARLLRQTAMLDYLEKQLVAMSGKRRNHSMVVKMREGLRKIRSLIEADKGTLSPQTVREIGQVCRELATVPSHRPV